MKLRILEQGPTAKVCAEVNDRGRCPVEKALRELEESKPHGQQAATVFRAKMHAIAALGTAGQESKYLKKIREGIWEFRCNGKERMLAWEMPDGKLVVIDVVLADAKKGEGKYQKEKINELIARYENMLNELSGGSILIE